MPRYIDADALLETEPEVCADYGEEYGTEFGYSRDQIANAPTISPDDVRGVGVWEDAKQHGLCRCSVCKDCYIERDYITQAKWKYCPSCGAKMTRAEAEKAMEVSEDA